jgi:SNF2 family DNA or RNA helicase
VQCVSFLGVLAETCLVRGPFLVVVPLSTVPNWIKEFRKWVPQVSGLVRPATTCTTDQLYERAGTALLCADRSVCCARWQRAAFAAFFNLTGLS